LYEIRHTYSFYDVIVFDGVSKNMAILQISNTFVEHDNF